MNKEMLSKTLVMGVICLFVGVGVQPAFAVENRVSADKMEKEEDCDCQEDSDVALNRLNKALKGLEGNTGFISFLSKRDPKIAEEYQELSNRINALTEMNEEYVSIWPFPVICSVLYFLLFLGFLQMMATGNSELFAFAVTTGITFNCPFV